MWATRAITALLVVAALATAAPAAGHEAEAAADPAVISEWNAIAVSTITGPAPAGAGKANPEAFLWYGFVHAAMYNAVVGITGRYDLYRWSEPGPAGASPEAAAAMAAYRVLDHYYGSNPTIAANLAVSLAASLADIPDGIAKEQGVRYGKKAADRIIYLRTGDGRGAAVTVDTPGTPGSWRPAPPSNAAFFAPWLAMVKPMTLRGNRQFRPGPPPAIDSATYVAEFNEVRDYGARTGSMRTAEQTQTAMFFSDLAIVPLQAGLRERATRRQMDISDAARLFAAVDVTLADTIGAVWDAKLHYSWWRPVTAIRLADDDGNPNTAGVPTWEPLVNTPAYPDWPSGTPAVVAAMSTVIERLDPAGELDLKLTSAAAGVTRHYGAAADLQQDVIDARVWSGIHFRGADEAGVELGNRVADWALSHYFNQTM